LKRVKNKILLKMPQTFPYQNGSLGVNESKIMRRGNEVRRTSKNIRIVKSKKEWSLKSKRVGENRLKKNWILKRKTNLENRNSKDWTSSKTWNSHS